MPRNERGAAECPECGQEIDYLLYDYRQTEADSFLAAVGEGQLVYHDIGRTAYGGQGYRCPACGEVLTRDSTAALLILLGG